MIRYDLTRESGALEPDEVVQSACQFCNSLCGIQVLKKSGRVIGIRGDEQDPVAQGGLCVKADMMPQLVYNPRRIKTPLKASDVPRLFTTETFCKVVIRAQRAAQG